MFLFRTNSPTQDNTHQDIHIQQNLRQKTYYGQIEEEMLVKGKISYH